MSDTSKIKDMLQDLINDRKEQAEMNIHDYIINKVQELAGTAKTPEVADLPIETGEIDTEIDIDAEDIIETDDLDNE